MTRVLAGLIAALAIVSPGAADDLQDLKAAHEATIKFLNDGDFTSWNAAFYEREIRFATNDPFPTDTEKASRSSSPGDYPLEFRRTTGVNLQYRVIGTTGLVWGYHRDVFKPKDGQLQSSLHRALLVYVKADGKWLRAATHLSAVPDGNW